ncbi:MAG: LmbE family protein [Firmicutes bacterium]|nr:LmbE family protein [Bacillota bacterium]
MRLRIIFKILFVTAGVAFVLYCLSSIYFYYQEKPEADIQLPPLPIVQKETRLLVIAPHCDDEALGCGGMIHDVIQAGGEFRIYASKRNNTGPEFTRGSRKTNPFSRLS